MSDLVDFELKGRAFFLTLWATSIKNMGYGDLLDDDGKPLDGTGEKIMIHIVEDFECSGNGRKCSGTACVSANDGFHLHIGIYVPNMIKFRLVHEFFGHAHIEPQRGTKSELVDYILKRGKWEEKGEVILYTTPNLDGIVGRQGGRSDLKAIEGYIEEGLTPREIMAMQFSYRRYEKMIKEAYYDKRDRETPFLREVEVIWHVGESGSGKSYVAQKLVEEIGEDGFYFVADYNSGGFDMYNGEPVLFLDEFRGQLRYSTLLSIMQGYKAQVYSRYTNTRCLWTTVHITSVLPPEMVYKNMVSENRDVDTFAQLKRRLSKVVYHWKDVYGEYRTFEMDAQKYRDYENLVYLAKKDDAGNDFVKVPDDADLPF